MSGKNDLSLFVYIVRPGHNNVIAETQSVSMIAAENDDAALAQLRSQYPAGQQLTIEQKGNVPMSQVMKMFNSAMEPQIVTQTKKDYYREIVEGMLRDMDYSLLIRHRKKHCFWL